MVAVAAVALIAIDIAGQQNDPVVSGEIGSKTYAAVVAAGATIQPSEQPAPRRRPPGRLALLDGEAN